MRMSRKMLGDVAEALPYGPRWREPGSVFSPLERDLMERIYAIRDPPKLDRLDGEARLSR